MALLEVNRRVFSLKSYHSSNHYTHCFNQTTFYMEYWCCLVLELQSLNVNGDNYDIVAFLFLEWQTFRDSFSHAYSFSDHVYFRVEISCANGNFIV